MTDTDAVDFRSLPLAEVLRLFAENGEPDDPRTDIDTASLIRRFPRLAGVQTQELSVEGAIGPIPVRVYRDPAAPVTDRGLVWVHGGAFIGGNLDMPEANWVSLELAARGIPVVSVDYTKCLGDVHFPVPSDDVLAAWRFVRAHAEDLVGVDASRLLLGGASAGGNLTAGAAARLRDAGETVPAGLVLVYPALHPNGSAPDGPIDPHAPHAPHSELSLNFAGSAHRLSDPHVFPGLGEGSGFPATLVVVCEEDDLRPSGEAFARLLTDAGVPTELYVEADADHGHINEPGDAGALRTLEAVTEWIRRLLAR